MPIYHWVAGVEQTMFELMLGLVGVVVLLVLWNFERRLKGLEMIK